jgi:CrcB protein
MMVLWVALAGACGAVARYVVHSAVERHAVSRFPYGTVIVNLSGSFALGFLTGLALYHGLAGDARTVVGTGFLGAYTTFSSFSYETFGLLRDGPRAGTTAALVNAFGSVLVGIAAATTGLVLAGVA